MDVSEDYEGIIGTFYIEEETPGSFQSQEPLILVLPEGVDWLEEEVRVYFDGQDITWDNVICSGNEMEINFQDLDGLDQLNKLEIRMAIYNSDVKGSITMNIEGEGAGVTEGSYVIARTDTGKGNPVVNGEINNITSAGYGSVISISEDAAGSMGTDQQHTWLELPYGYNWGQMNDPDLVKFLGGFWKTSLIKIKQISPRLLDIEFMPPLQRDNLGLIEIKPYILADKDTEKGPVEVVIEGTNVDK